MNANVVSAGGRERGQGASDETSLPESLMAHTVNETVYLGRASFRITHEMEAVDAEGSTADSAEWFSRESAVILEGGPNERGVLRARRDGTEQAGTARAPRFRRSWLLVALPVGAFALGIAVASVVGSGARRRSPVAATALTPVAATAPAPVAPTTVAPAAPPLPPVAATTVPATTSPAAAPPSGTTVAVSAAPAIPEAPAATPEKTAVPSTALPPSTVALALPAEARSPREAAATPDAPPAPAAAPRAAPAAVKPHVVRKAKVEHAKTSGKAADKTVEATADDVASAPSDDAPATEAAAPATKKTAAKAPVKWVDPWAN